jgi:hypothetical protein
LLKAFTKEERKRAREFQIKVSQHGDSNGNVFINHIYVSAAFPNGDSFNPSENAGKSFVY